MLFYIVYYKVYICVFIEKHMYTRFHRYIMPIYVSIVMYDLRSLTLAHAWERHGICLFPIPPAPQKYTSKTTYSTVAGSGMSMKSVKLSGASLPKGTSTNRGTQKVAVRTVYIQLRSVPRLLTSTRGIILREGQFIVETTLFTKRLTCLFPSG